MKHNQNSTELASPSLLGVRGQNYYVDMELPPDYDRTTYYVYATDEAAAEKAFEEFVRGQMCGVHKAP